MENKELFATKFASGKPPLETLRLHDGDSRQRWNGEWAGPRTENAVASYTSGILRFWILSNSTTRTPSHSCVDICLNLDKMQNERCTVNALNIGFNCLSLFERTKMINIFSINTFKQVYLLPKSSRCSHYAKTRVFTSATQMGDITNCKVSKNEFTRYFWLVLPPQFSREGEFRPCYRLQKLWSPLVQLHIVQKYDQGIRLRLKQTTTSQRWIPGNGIIDQTLYCFCYSRCRRWLWKSTTGNSAHTAPEHGVSCIDAKMGRPRDPEDHW